MQKGITWHGMAWESEEHCEISESSAGIEARGDVRGTTVQGVPFEVNYVLELSPTWEVQHVLVSDAMHEGRCIELVRENNQWYDGDENHLEAYDSIAFVDISITPFTNTLPIRRLSFKDTEPQTIEVLYIDVPGFELSRAEQRYTKLGTHTYHYEDNTVSADLVVDDDGLVMVYPDLFTGRTSSSTSDEHSR